MVSQMNILKKGKNKAYPFGIFPTKNIKTHEIENIEYDLAVLWMRPMLS
jgi:hypothetical protein